MFTTHTPAAPVIAPRPRPVRASAIRTPAEAVAYLAAATERHAAHVESAAR